MTVTVPLYGIRDGLPRLLLQEYELATRLLPAAPTEGV
ncbi:MAG: hypothetical protein QOG07_4018 [Pseudonocardiales bacterium]|jgi:hypothetical protein|nr:hypothetical protein [Pseudonocardiales bacterium]MDT4982139.1 hypothetical protein [Pseudonocardiales bacterium]